MLHEAIKPFELKLNITKQLHFCSYVSLDSNKKSKTYTPKYYTKQMFLLAKNKKKKKRSKYGHRILLNIQIHTHKNYA